MKERGGPSFYRWSDPWETCTCFYPSYEVGFKTKVSLYNEKERVMNSMKNISHIDLHNHPLFVVGTS
jgi:hypothetical protein